MIAFTKLVLASDHVDWDLYQGRMAAYTRKTRCHFLLNRTNSSLFLADVFIQDVWMFSNVLRQHDRSHSIPPWKFRLSPTTTMAFARSVENAAHELNPDLVLFDETTVELRDRSASFGQRVAGTFVGAFGLLALALAAIGIYGVTAYLRNAVPGYWKLVATLIP